MTVIERGGEAGGELATYRNRTPYPFCPGCGHAQILDRLDDALVALQPDPAKLVIVSDIGCSGLSDQYFATSAFHGLHGRSITYATGIKLARPDLDVIVVMGDGGTGIGGAHLLNAARRNIGITVLVFNNFNYGMTGGQHSATTPTGARTATTPGGNLERPLDLCATVAANGAGYVHRGTSFDPDLAERIAEGVRHPGFALLDVWELCTAHYVPRNKASKRTLGETLDALGFETGVLQRLDRPEYAAALRRELDREVVAAEDGSGDGRVERLAELAALHPAGGPIEPRFTSRLDRRLGIVLAGAAGGRVRSSARLLARAAVLSGLWAAQRDDYPVTVKTGHSVAQLVVGPEPVGYAGIERPDALLVLSEEGRRKAAPLLARMTAGGTLFVLPPFAGLEPPPGVERVVLDPEESPEKVAAAELGLFATVAMAARLERQQGFLPPEALQAAARMTGPGGVDRVEPTLRTVRAGLALAGG